MAITPAGSPAWTRLSTAATYGGTVNKRNLGDFGAINARTDVTAEQYIRMCQDVAHAVRTAPLFWMRFTVDAAPSLIVTVEAFQAMWAPAAPSYVAYSGGASQTPPDVRYPTITTAGFGVHLLISFPDLAPSTTIDVADDYGVVGSCLMSATTLSGPGTATWGAAVTGGGIYVLITNGATTDATAQLVVR